MASQYDESEYPPFAVAVDLVVLTIREDVAGELSVLLIERKSAPHKGRLALPGGFTHVEEDLEDAAYRELEEEAGLQRREVHLEQLRTYGAPRRDPRMRVVSVAWLALGASLPEPTAGSDAAAARWVPLSEATTARLAFDHATILADGVERARAKLEYSDLAAAFVGRVFTVAELRRVYEAVWGTSLDPGNFHRKVTGVPDFLEPTGRRTAGARGRPAALYKRGRTRTLNPPVMRPGG